MAGAMRATVLAWTLAVVTLACGDNAIETDVGSDSTYEAQEVEQDGAVAYSPDSGSMGEGGVAGVESTVPAVAPTTVPVRLLEEVIPPCVPLEGVDHDPCEPSVPPGVIDPSISTGNPYCVLDPPSLREIMEGFGVFFLIPHIVIRATVVPDTTRCEGYQDTSFEYVGGVSRGEMRGYYCFANVRVNEYIVGEGPAYLTVGLSRNTFPDFPGHRWSNRAHRAAIIEHEFGNPAVQVANAYEGREVVLFLRLPLTRKVEAWVVGGVVDVWFVLEDTNGPTARGEGESGDGTTEYSTAMRYEDKVVSEIALDDLVASVKEFAPVREAAVQATTATTSAGAVTSTTAAGGASSTTGAGGSGGSLRDATTTTTDAGTITTAVVGTTLPVGSSTTGSIRGLPFIVDRADRLRDFYVAEGAVYEGENATVLPPPAPISPGVPTNVELSQVENQVLITWDPPIDRGEADSYYVWLVWGTEDNHQIFKDLKTLRRENMFEFDITNMSLVYGPDLTVQVRAQSTYGTSDWSPIQTFTTPTSS